MKVDVAVLGSPSLTVRTVSVDVKQHLLMNTFRVLELCESRGGRPGIPVPNSPYGLCGRKATLNLNLTAQVVVAVLGFPSLISLMVSVDVKQH